MNDHLMVVLLLLLVGSGILILAARRVLFWRAEGKRVLTNGYVPPLPGWFARFVRCCLGRLFVFLYIGRLRIIGAHNVKYRGRFIVLGNHQTERDAVLVPYLMGMRQARYFIAKTQSLGWRAPLIAFTGGIVVEHASKRGPVAALSAAIKTMIAEPRTDFVIFPQGKLVRDNKLERADFFPGVALLGRKVADKSPCDCAEIAYLPLAIYYDRDPSHATWFHRLMNAFGFRNFRRFFGEVIYGAVVVVGEPIPVECLPEKPESATDELFNCIVTLSARAESQAAR